MTPGIYAYIFTMAAVTYIIRVLPLTAFTRQVNNRFIKSFLYYVPYATLAAMPFPTIIHAEYRFGRGGAGGGHCDGMAGLGYVPRGIFLLRRGFTAGIVYKIEIKIPLRLMRRKSFRAFWHRRGCFVIVSLLISGAVLCGTAKISCPRQNRTAKMSRSA